MEKSVVILDMVDYFTDSIMGDEDDVCQELADDFDHNDTWADLIDRLYDWIQERKEEAEEADQGEEEQVQL